MNDDLPPPIPDVPLPPIQPDLAFTSIIRLPELLQALRERTGMSQIEVDDAFGIAQPQLSAWEQGHKLPTERSLWRVALAYASRIPGADPAKMFGHLKHARDHQAASYEWDYDIVLLADRLQLHPEGERSRLAKSLLVVLREFERGLPISPPTGDNPLAPGDIGDSLGDISPDGGPVE